MRIAYADPPYPGQAKRHYGDHPDYAGEVDHAALIEQMEAEFPDGWALSTSSTGLKQVLALCPDDVRIAAWAKSFAVFHCNPAYAWEPVIFKGGRKRRGYDRSEVTVRDWIVAMPPIFQKKEIDQTKGQKPQEFCFWLFDLMGMQEGDELHDLFPGSGAVTECWGAWISQLRLAA